MDKADFFIQRTFYNEAPKLVKNFSDVKYTCGYGIILKKKKKKLIKKKYYQKQIGKNIVI